MICEELFGSISNYCLLVHTYSLFDVLLYKTSHSGVHSYGTLFSFQRSSPFVTACLSYQTQKNLSRTFLKKFWRTSTVLCEVFRNSSFIISKLRKLVNNLLKFFQIKTSTFARPFDVPVCPVRHKVFYHQNKKLSTHNWQLFYKNCRFKIHMLQKAERESLFVLWLNHDK